MHSVVVCTALQDALLEASKIRLVYRSVQKDFG